MSWWIIWLGVFIVMLVIEAATTALATVWFAVGALVAMIMDLCGVFDPPIWAPVAEYPFTNQHIELRG